MKNQLGARYIPKNALPITEEGLGAVYVYRINGKSGLRYGVIAYREKAINNSFHYTYKTDAQVDEAIERFFNDLRQHKALVIERRAREYSGHSFKVGDIVTNSWGYDQTNVDWYRVTRMSANYVWLKPVHSAMDSDESSGPMSGHVGLALDENLKPIDGKGKETKHRASGDTVTMRHGCGSKYTGGTQYVSWYA